MRKQWLLVFITILVVILVLGSCGKPPPPAPTTEPGEFPDENLKVAIRDALYQLTGEAITAAELAQLTELRLERYGIADISGLEYCTNLTVLIISRNQISDISPLVALNKLTYPQSGIQQFLKRLLNKAGLGEVKCSPHILRHTFATRSLTNGANVLVLRDIMGHESLVTTMKYAHLQPRDLQQQHAKFSPVTELFANRS